MKKIFVFLLTAATILITGCVDITTNVKVNKDGTGTVTERILISKMVVEMINEFSRAFSDSANVQEEFSLFKEEELQNKASALGEGVEYLSGELISENGKEGYTAVYKFKDINKVHINQNPDNYMPELDADIQNIEMQDTSKFMTFKFDKGDESVLQIILPSAAKEDSAGEEKEEDITGDTAPDSSIFDDPGAAKLKEMMTDMQFNVTVTIDGEISETNASFIDGSTITLFKINFNEIIKNPEAFEKLRETESKDLRTLEKIMKSIPGIKAELAPVVTVKFK